MTIGTVTLMASGADVASTATTPFNVVTASFTCTAGRLYMLFTSATASSNGVTAGQNTSTNWAYQKTQTATTNQVIELFGGLCTTTTTATATINFPAAATCTYAIVEVTNTITASTPILQKLSAAALTVAMAAATGVQPAIFESARNSGTALTVKAGYTQVVNIGATHKLLVGYNPTFDTAPSYSATTSTNPSIIGAEISTIAPTIRGFMLLGVGT